MEGLKLWIISLIFSAAAGTLISVISPGGANDKTMKTVIGIFVISAVCLPLSEIKTKDFELPVFNTRYDDIADKPMENFLIEAMKKEIFSIAEKTAKANECEISDIKIDAEYDENNCIIIHKITVYFKENKSEEALKTAEKIENELGVPVIAE